MAIPLDSNWRKIDASGSDRFDPTLYRQLIGSLMYLVNTRLDISFAVNSLCQFMLDPQSGHDPLVIDLKDELQQEMDIQQP